ncbi:MAG: histidinol dehydrogenase [Candidatus Atribacteria bacterium]|nr:histidinol dehydrogenase [Candidatus Atribacteria bacterium]
MNKPEIVVKPLQIADLNQDLNRDRRSLYRYFNQIEKEVREIIEKVEQEGDRALLFYAQEFDGCKLPSLRVEEKELETSWNQVEDKFKETVTLVSQSIRDFHQNQKTSSWWNNQSGSLWGEKVQPLNSVACYVPGGRFSYPSSLLMTAIPAQIAGVARIVVLTPPGETGVPAREILATAHFLGLKEVYLAGGAQAVAACTFGTESIPRVNKIVGPGNIYLTTAKKLLYGLIGIDSLAGPSEVAIVASECPEPRWLALDLLAQAEHDPLSLSILISPQEKILLEVKKYLEREWQNHPLPFSKSVPFYFYQVENLNQAAEAVNSLAPEHLELWVPNPLSFLRKIKNAGAVFLGPLSPVALGDYGYGPNHVLPTLGSATFASSLSVRDFNKTIPFLSPTAEGLSSKYEFLAYLASKEGLFFHQKSILARKQTGLASFFID